MARDTTKAQFAQYGMISIPDDVLENYAQEMLKKKETIRILVNRVVEVKLATALKAQVELWRTRTFLLKNSIRCLNKKCAYG